MLLQFYTELENSELNKFFKEETTIWDVLPGICYAEKKVYSLDELCSLMRKLEEITGLPLSFELQIVPKHTDDDEEMATVKISNAKLKIE